MPGFGAEVAGIVRTAKAKSTERTTIGATSPPKRISRLLRTSSPRAFAAAPAHDRDREQHQDDAEARSRRRLIIVHQRPAILRAASLCGESVDWSLPHPEARRASRPSGASPSAFATAVEVPSSSRR